MPTVRTASPLTAVTLIVFVLPVSAQVPGAEPNRGGSGSPYEFLGANHRYPYQDGKHLVWQFDERVHGEDRNGDGDTDDRVVLFYDESTLRTRIVPRQGALWIWFVGDQAVVPIHEWWEGADLNGDGDLEDSFLHRWEPATNTWTNLWLQAEVVLAVFGSRFYWYAREWQDGLDWNNDGDTGDQVLQSYQLQRDRFRNYRTAASAKVSREGLVVSVWESGQKKDLNGDGDQADAILHAIDGVSGRVTRTGKSFLRAGRALADGIHVAFFVSEAHEGWTDLNGDGDVTDSVLHLLNLTTGVVTNLGFAGYASAVASIGTEILFQSFEGQNQIDSNGDGDLDDLTTHLYDLVTGQLSTLPIAASLDPWGVDENVHALFIREQDEGGRDRNGDGDADDRLLALWTGGNQWVDTFLPVLPSSWEEVVEARDGVVWFNVPEGEDGIDRNGDGDTADSVLFRWDPVGPQNLGLALPLEWMEFSLVVTPDHVLVRVDEAAQRLDLNQDGDRQDSVLHMMDPDGTDLRNLGVASGWPMVRAELPIVSVSEAADSHDWNHDGDETDFVLLRVR